MQRLLIVSNRLPVTVKADPNGAEVVASTGGLATGLGGPHARSGGLWIGWPGDLSGVPASARPAIEEELAARRTVPVHLTPEEVKRYYNGFSNGVIWPLFHYLVDRVPLEGKDWDAYRAVNEKFAAVVAEHYRPGDVIWVHDYQLMLVPALLRRMIPAAQIGFFLHIPFPSSELFRTLPWRDAILDGLLGADLVGFHAFSYARNFSTSLIQVRGLEPRDASVTVEGREVHFGVFPMGIDVASFQALAAEPSVREEASAIRSEARGQQLLLGIDRLDYTKGIPQRLTAFERLLDRAPELHGRVRLIQLAVPSRAEIDTYAETRAEVEELVGRVNGKFGTPVWTPIHYLYRSVSPRHVTALYLAADVMLVTPLRDGMNLVAKEFVASRTDGDGVLVLSEFAGAAAELGTALLVNPFHIDGVADAIGAALRMSRRERRSRMAGLRRRVLDYDVHKWAGQFLESLSGHDQTGSQVVRPAPLGIAALMLRLNAAVHQADKALLLLYYDCALVPPASIPDLAAPDEDLLALLAALAQRRNLEIHVVSARAREVLDAWLGALPITLHAEDGLWTRPAGGDWLAPGALSDEWKKGLRPILDEFVARTPGTFVEEKSASLVWHYRHADPEFGVLQARELRLHLANAFSNAPVEILVRDKLVEVRRQGLRKELVTGSLRESERACVVAIGNDALDERLFDALPKGAITIHVGREATRAQFRLANAAQARGVLRALLELGERGSEAEPIGEVVSASPARRPSPLPVRSSAAR
jgi:trehalose 6-phosphate synthase/phosphatase